MSNQRCANCDREFDDDEVVKVWGGNICKECAGILFGDDELKKYLKRCLRL